MLSQSGGGLPQLPKDKSTTQTTTEQYSFAAEPKALQQQGQQRKKYRDAPPAAEKDRLAYAPVFVLFDSNQANINLTTPRNPVNIMHDRRIHRGSTYAVPIGALVSRVGVILADGG